MTPQEVPQKDIFWEGPPELPLDLSEVLPLIGCFQKPIKEETNLGKG